jgi:ankyrin repeat protein
VLVEQPSGEVVQRTALVAVLHGQLEVLRLLLARGVAVDAAHLDCGGKAFHLACFHNHAGCAEAVARAGCDVGAKVTKSGLTGPEMAGGKGHVAEVARLRALVAERSRAAQTAAGSSEPEMAPNGESLGQLLWDAV